MAESPISTIDEVYAPAVYEVDTLGQLLCRYPELVNAASGNPGLTANCTGFAPAMTPSFLKLPMTMVSSREPWCQVESQFQRRPANHVRDAAKRNLKVGQFLSYPIFYDEAR
jgi:hypothetical protein